MPRNIGADPSGRQYLDAIAASMGVRAQLSTARKMSPAVTARKSQGSLESLDTAKPVWIQPNASGYRPVRSHGPRLPHSLPRIPSASLGSRGMSNMVDYRRGSGGSSMKMRSMNKINRMF